MTATARELGHLWPIGIILVCAALVASQESYSSPKLVQLVPTIRQGNYELAASEDKYYLWLNLPEGGSRAENVELLTNENGKKVLTVKGSLNLVYRDTPLEVTVIYEADGNGYRARYMYASKQTVLTNVAFASANLLKSAAG
ncbi:uncharacterized protein LOC129238532 [Anastrepha obliqua]|uniref:uncharacterized protein LOC129238532 n=1 Tax=Anastrepha obliqua TaxID=95512 RepID=UPI00240A1E9E|nr:uncharacterized protein LOC129238532 [Anastrepha obliqua]